MCCQKTCQCRVTDSWSHRNFHGPRLDIGTSVDQRWPRIHRSCVANHEFKHRVTLSWRSEEKTGDDVDISWGHLGDLFHIWSYLSTAPELSRALSCVVLNNLIRKHFVAVKMHRETSTQLKLGRSPAFRWLECIYVPHINKFVLNSAQPNDSGVHKEHRFRSRNLWIMEIWLRSNHTPNVWIIVESMRHINRWQYFSKCSKILFNNVHLLHTEYLELSNSILFSFPCHRRQVTHRIDTSPP